MYERFNYTMKNAMPIEDRIFLDVGCGTGHYSLALARKNARRVIAMDISSNMISICKERAKHEGTQDTITFVQSDLLQYESAEWVDVCIGIGLFDYIKHPLPVLRRMQELATDKVIASFPRLWTWRAPVRKVRLGLKNCDVHFYTEQRLASLLEKAGFKNFTVKTVGKLFCVTASIL